MLAVCKSSLRVQTGLDRAIGHDVVMGDYTALASCVHSSGWTRFGRRVYVGTGAVIIHSAQEESVVTINGVVIGASVCVTKPLSADLTVVGAPAKLPRRS